MVDNKNANPIVITLDIDPTRYEVPVSGVREINLEPVVWNLKKLTEIRFKFNLKDELPIGHKFWIFLNNWRNPMHLNDKQVNPIVDSSGKTPVVCKQGTFDLSNIQSQFTYGWVSDSVSSSSLINFSIVVVIGNNTWTADPQIRINPPPPPEGF